ncbi:epithelial-stromal interaction protein 1 [Tiliqua scincoides]|uniref:epithelial-stromal interaction protein 1 n=1 Tax=Tiliqua scincoides TaxID=71010 RepID=UPI003462820A
MSKGRVGSFRSGMAGASPSYSRQYQAGDPFSQRKAHGDLLDYEARGQENLPGQESSFDQEQRSDAYTVIPPNPARRNQLQKIAKKELEELERWKEQHRPGPINLTPQKLGGRALESEVRQKQQLEHIQSKYQQKLKMQDYEKIKREAEEADLLKKKVIQREKANKLEEKRRHEEYVRKQMLDEDNLLKTAEFLSRLDLCPPKTTSCQAPHCSLESTAWARSQAYKQIQRQEENLKLQKMKEEQRKKAEWLEFKQQQDERARRKAHQNERLRVNNAFLDRLPSRPCNVCHSEYLGNVDSDADGWDF